MFGHVGCDIVGMNGMPEAILARELEMCYATICIITNMAAGLQEILSTDAVLNAVKKSAPVLERILRGTIKRLSEKRKCSCSHALDKARFGS
jgi:5'-methylthioadenosine phosphorylase